MIRYRSWSTGASTGSPITTISTSNVAQSSSPIRSRRICRIAGSDVPGSVRASISMTASPGMTLCLSPARITSG